MEKVSLLWNCVTLTQNYNENFGLLTNVYLFHTKNENGISGDNRYHHIAFSCNWNVG